ncbi:MAG: hypothetical protein UX38_C0018G0005 [Microgenomates group bacterium GW2011_GWC1_46_16]|uniref:Uncharacterized protein n=3 Tax=Candidatus Woeseibacteriota TaxID=1752722 RepID=A0A837I8S6_9BACT|nr:MAG: hypothetical protein UW20_C0013G0004 [Candidatus Woesebacteria bacterium GW2011_GWB1_44_11]KKT53951.1 MAG: hypothetical protein UW47_C0013G0005 [Candidatus Woesebacteria bacterium GW2011_GWA1_44_23]KKU25715.1 MAG: hypothetical protein UX38_C0018G0005 [Microgenomates group bacterium GW2011_GWC1_46_16]OGM76146.1 MAG: hypothetical protein A2208_00120 [Candidatus Woesebacteria bacterium RIFOXYA1_FULL_43_16]OGM81731.1 MAG: hypothetical protein A2394_02515 [Candidatus Woesebacteria bacterium 
MSVASVLKNPEVLELPLFQLESRPYFGKRQIRNLHQLTPNQKIIIHGPEESEIKARVICVYKENGHLKLDYQHCKGQEPQVGTIYLKDYSVIRCDDRNWEPLNWLEKA